MSFLIPGSLRRRASANALVARSPAAAADASSPDPALVAPTAIARLEQHATIQQLSSQAFGIAEDIETWDQPELAAGWGQEFPAATVRNHAAGRGGALKCDL